MRVFPPSEIEHPWRTSLAYVSVSVWLVVLIVSLIWLADAPLLWLLRLMGPFEWQGPVSA